MPKYVGYITISKYRSFEFEADDADLAWDHLDTLVSNYGERLEEMWDESGEDQIFCDDVVEVSNG